MTKLNSYKVEFSQIEHFIVDVQATSEEEARQKAEIEWENENYQEQGDCAVGICDVYDVTGTDDDAFLLETCPVCRTKTEDNVCVNKKCEER